MSVAIKFGTDGWRAIIADDYTVENVKRVAEGTARWMKSKNMSKVVIGHDCRFGGALFAQTSARVFGAHGFHIYLAKGYVSTPMVSLGTVKQGADMGIVITASHNPPSYNGFKLKSAYGGPTIPSDVAAVEAQIPDQAPGNLPEISALEQSGQLEYIDLEKMYLDHVRANFDLELIRNANIKLAYDAMYGAGQNVVRTLFPDAHLLHCDDNPGFHGQAPEPIEKNLGEIMAVLKSDPSLNLGLANDGDADRIGLFDADGNFVDSHHILLLLLLYMYEYKKQTGKVVFTFSVTDKLKKMAEQYGLPYEITKIGFKYIAEIMTNEDVIVGGEESGGLAVKGHIPERDGVWIGLMIMEFMARTGKSLQDLIQEVYAKVGPFAFDRDDLHLLESQKQDIIAACNANTYKQFGDEPIVRTETTDGYKFYLNDDEWVLIRPSGTEPVLRVYAQTPNRTRCRVVLDKVKSTLGV